MQAARKEGQKEMTIGLAAVVQDVTATPTKQLFYVRHIWFIVATTGVHSKTVRCISLRSHEKSWFVGPEEPPKMPICLAVC